VENLAGRVRVEGHTDDRPIRHSAFSSNYALSLARAHAVARFLVETGRISPGRIGAAGFGADRPAVPNDSADGRSANRRVEIIVLAEGTAPHE
jgi:chemotaxis protein MotB